jgi:hypothetical protein
MLIISISLSFSAIISFPWNHPKNKTILILFLRVEYFQVDSHLLSQRSKEGLEGGYPYIGSYILIPHMRELKMHTLHTHTQHRGQNDLLGKGDYQQASTRERTSYSILVFVHRTLIQLLNSETCSENQK